MYVIANTRESMSDKSFSPTFNVSVTFYKVTSTLGQGHIQCQT